MSENIFNICHFPQLSLSNKISQHIFYYIFDIFSPHDLKQNQYSLLIFYLSQLD